MTINEQKCFLKFLSESERYENIFPLVYYSFWYWNENRGSGRPDLARH